MDPFFARFPTFFRSEKGPSLDLFFSRNSRDLENHIWKLFTEDHYLIHHFIPGCLLIKMFFRSLYIYAKIFSVIFRKLTVGDQFWCLQVDFSWRVWWVRSCRCQWLPCTRWGWLRPFSCTCGCWALKRSPRIPPDQPGGTGFVRANLKSYGLNIDYN